MSSVEVIINAAAGAGAQNGAARAVTEAFAACGVEARLTVARAGAVVAGGGDGTVGAVASALAGTDRPLGVLPLGTLNHFAKDLKIPLDTGEAARGVCEGRIITGDEGGVNGQHSMAKDDESLADPA